MFNKKSINSCFRINHLVFLLVFSNLLNAQVNIDTTKIEYVSWENHQYAFIRNIKPNMIDAKCSCEKLGMQLVKIESESENSFLQNKAFEKEGVQAADGIQYWVGASDLDEEGKWIWISLGIIIDEDKLMDEVGEPKKYGPSFDKDDNSVVDW